MRKIGIKFHQEDLRGVKTCLVHQRRKAEPHERKRHIQIHLYGEKAHAKVGLQVKEVQEHPGIRQQRSKCEQ